MNTVGNLHQAKKNRQDDFYTGLAEIEQEMGHYFPEFEGKTIYCNCDDPRVSNFFYYFSHQFETLKLKRLITTCYRNDDPDLFSKDDKDKAVYLEYEGDKNNNKVPDPEEIDVKPLKGNGDFRSDECIAMLKKADIVVTNPPFSLFREYVAQLIKYEKKFIIIGNMNAITYKEIFPLIMQNKIWLGPSISSGDREFGVPDSYPLKAAGCRQDETGKKFIRVKGVRWWTNIDHKRRHDDLPLGKTYNENDYPKYDNYDAIEVSKTKDIPMDYDGVMGVPITFLDRYNPEQFEILGCTQRGCHDSVPDTKKYDSYKEMRPDGTPTGSSGGKTNENANVAGNDGKKNYFTNGKHTIQSKYGRIFIRNRKVRK